MVFLLQIDIGGSMWCGTLREGSAVSLVLECATLYVTTGQQPGMASLPSGDMEVPSNSSKQYFKAYTSKRIRTMIVVRTEISVLFYTFFPYYDC